MLRVLKAQVWVSIFLHKLLQDMKGKYGLKVTKEKDRHFMFGYRQKVTEVTDYYLQKLYSED